MDDDEYMLPPGCKMSILPHPWGIDDAVELALFQDHRYAFFFWSSWTKKLELDAAPPALVSLDWHEDLVAPDETEQQALLAINQDDKREIALFCWEELNQLNDGQILASAFLNLIGDIYVVRKQIDVVENVFQDSQGRGHRIRCFDTIDELVAELKDTQIERVFFDVDLDYFTESEDGSGGGDNVKLVPDEEIRAALDPSSELMLWIFRRLAGMTIATEPEFCGGIANSNHLVSVVSETLFAPQLLADDATWKHLENTKA